jgi:uncharacterized protein involved in type VI secretion and phage assembly
VSAELERTIAELVRQTEQRYHGKYRGLVVDNRDPENLGRLRVQVPSVLGEEVITGWAMPCVPYGGNADSGWFVLPDAGAAVWVEFEEGDLEFPVWVGTYWSKPGGTSEVPEANDRSGAASGEPPATRRILKTTAGNTIQLEDKAGEEMILIHQAAAELTIVMDKDGIELVHKSGSFIRLTKDGVAVHAKGKLTLEAPGETVEIIGKKIELKSG